MSEMNSRILVVTLMALALVVALAHGPSLEFGYPADAHHAVRANPIVEHGSPARIFRSHYWEETAFAESNTLYRPVTVLSFAVERRLTGEPNPFVSHLVNLLLHLTTAALLLVYSLRCGGGLLAAGVAALIFGVHPLLLAAVSNVVGRGDLLAALFSLAALLCLGATGSRPGAVTPGPGLRRIASWATAALLFLALGAKEIALATPLLLLAHEALFRFPNRDRRPGWWIERAAALAPSGLAVSIYLGLRTAAIEGFPGLQQVRPMDNVLVTLDGMPQAATTLAMLGRYTGLLIYPARLSFDYSGTAIRVEDSLFAPLPLLGLLVLATMLVLTAAPWVGRRQAEPAARSRRCFVSAAALLILLPYSIVGNLFVLNGAGFAERMIYFPAAGFCMLLGATLALTASRLAPSRRTVFAAATVIPLLLGGILATRVLSPMYRSEQELFTAAIEATPGSLRAHYSLADIRRGQGRADEALSLYRRALEIDPGHAPSLQWSAVIEADRGNFSVAETSLRRALALRPSLSSARMYLGILQAATARPAEARASLRKALVREPGLIPARAQLAHLLYEGGDYTEAALHYRICVNRGRTDLRPNLARAEAGMPTSAIPAP